MCSIIGYYGHSNAFPILVNGLKRMEYRGYDSVGISIMYKNKISTKKIVGRITDKENIIRLKGIQGNIGIGHTRWATHGNITKNNAHPHNSNSGMISVVHNGIIENFKLLKTKLQKKYTFNSNTDTEVIANLLQQNFERTTDIKKTAIKTISELKGRYAFAAIIQKELLIVKCGMPLIIGIRNNEFFIASDVLGIIENTKNIIYLKENSLARVYDNTIKMYGFNGIQLKYEIIKSKIKVNETNKGKYKYFTFKEIIEQCKIMRIQKNVNNTIKKVARHIIINDIKRLYLIGSGTSYNAAKIGKYLISKYCDINVESIVSCEFLFLKNNKKNKKSTVIAISQSGETGDVMEAIDIAKKNHMKIISITNVSTSSLVQKSLYSINVNCGKEIGVAATKSFTSQLIIIYRLVEELSNKKLIDLKKISNAIVNIISQKSVILSIAKKLKKISNIYILGSDINYQIAIEAALKLKEIAHIHAEGITGGELKHGHLSMIDTNTYTIVINPSDITYKNMIININEIKLRGSKIIGISDVNNEIYDYWIKIPHVDNTMFPIIEIVPIQLLAYYLALEKKLNPDYPINLAKSITVR